MKRLLTRRIFVGNSKAILKPNLPVEVQRPMKRRLERFTTQELAVEKIAIDYINDITVGWDIDEVTYDEATELFRSLAKRMMRDSLRIPNQLWNGWIYVILMQNSPQKSRIPSLKYLGKPESSLPHRERMDAVAILLKEQNLFDQTESGKEEMDRFYDFLLRLPKSPADVSLVLRGYLLLKPEQRSALGWEKFIVKFIYYKETPFELAMELINLMMVQDKFSPSEQFLPILKHWISQNRRNNNAFSMRFVNRLVSESSLFNDFVTLGLLDADMNSTAVDFIRLKLAESKSSISGDVVGYTIYRLFKMKKNLLAFALLRDIAPATWQIDYPESIRKELERIPSQVFTRLLSQDFCEYVFAGLISGRFGKIVRELIDQNEHGFVKTEKLYNVIVQSYLTLPHPDLCQGSNVLQHMSKLGFKVYRKTYLDLVQAYYHDHNMSGVENALREMLQTYPADLPTYALVLKMDVEIDGMANPTEIFNHMLRNNIFPDARFFVNWLQKLIKDKQYEQVPKVFEISKEHIQPTVPMYSIVINSLVKQDKLMEAQGWLKTMIEQGRQPNRVTFSTLMNGYLRKNEFPRALFYYGKMIGYQFHTNTLSYLSPSEMADTTVIWTMLDVLLQHNMIETFEFVFAKTMASGFKLQHWRMVQIIEILLSLGYVWPVVFIPKLLNQEFAKKCLLQAKSNILSKSNEVSYGPEIFEKLESVFENFGKSIEDKPPLVRYQWICVKLLSEDFCLEETFEKDKIPVVLSAIGILLIQVVQRQLSFSVDSIPISCPLKKDFVERMLAKIGPSAEFGDYSPVFQFERPKFMPTIVNGGELVDDESFIELAKPYFQDESVPRVATVEAIASDMFPTIVGCMRLYHRLMKSKLESAPKQIMDSDTSIPLTLVESPIAESKVDLRLKHWTKSNSVLEIIFKDHSRALMLALEDLKGKHINQENISKSCKAMAESHPESSAFFEWLGQYRYSPSLLKRLKSSNSALRSSSFQ